MAKIARPVRPLADVNVLPQKDGSNEIVVCFLPDPDILVGEGESRAFLALDASVSLRKMYGGIAGPFGGGEPNYVQAVARKLGNILSSVSKSGKVSGIYWAVTHDGGKTMPIGEFDADGWNNANIPGPGQGNWGRGTKMLPAIKQCIEQVAKGADWTIGVVITDGIIEDEQDCINYCLKVGKEMASGKMKPAKLVLIGIGEEVDEDQLERFDDMFEGTGIDYDLWSHGMVASMQDEADILNVLYGELMDEDTIVAPNGRVETASGQQIATWPDGLPGKFRFVLPKGENEFTIRVPNQSVTQDISEALVHP